MIQAVVFDMDGVIFDSETLLTDCWVDATRADGIPDVAHTNYLCLGVNDAETKEKFLEEYPESGRDIRSPKSDPANRKNGRKRRCS